MYIFFIIVYLQDATPAANNLASSLVKNCADTLEPLICGFLTSCFMEKDSIQSNLKDSYHEIIFMISLNAPQILLAVIPNLTQELLVFIIHFRSNNRVILLFYEFG